MRPTGNSQPPADLSADYKYAKAQSTAHGADETSWLNLHHRIISETMTIVSSHYILESTVMQQ